MKLGLTKYLKGASHPSQHDYHKETRRTDTILHETLSPNTQKREEREEETRRGKGGKGEEKKGETSTLSQVFVPGPCSQLLRRLRQEGP